MTSYQPGDLLLVDFPFSSGRGSATLNWTDNSTSETGFYIERAPSGTASFVRVGTAGANVKTFTDKVSRGTYLYRVQAFDATSVSAYSNTVTVRARRLNKEKNLNGSGRCSMDARYTVRVPKSFNSELRTGGGTIMVAEITGTMSADTSGGKLKFTHLKGPTGATTSGGSIELSGCDGPLKVDTSGGRIEASDGSGSLGKPGRAPSRVPRRIGSSRCVMQLTVRTGLGDGEPPA